VQRSAAPSIAIAGVTKRFGPHVALHDVSLAVPPETCLALIGPSGSGKSTLVRIVVGLLEPDAGRVLVGDVPVTRDTRRALRLRTGYVIQEGGLFPHLTAAENAAVVARDQGWSGARVRSRLEELAALVHLSPDMLARHPVQLSGGQRQRVGLIRALMLDPDVLVMDEPLAALDPIIRARLQDDLRELIAALRKTVLLVTHDMAEAAHLGDAIALLHEGRVVQHGPARDLLERPATPFVTEFIRAQRSLEAVVGAGR
jgi:osmoprotectant transport system ATP-binding protein